MSEYEEHENFIIKEKIKINKKEEKAERVSISCFRFSIIQIIVLIIFIIIFVDKPYMLFIPFIIISILYIISIINKFKYPENSIIKEYYIKSMFLVRYGIGIAMMIFIFILMIFNN